MNSISKNCSPCYTNTKARKNIKNSMLSMTVKRNLVKENVNYSKKQNTLNLKGISSYSATLKEIDCDKKFLLIDKCLHETNSSSLTFGVKKLNEVVPLRTNKKREDLSCNGIFNEDEFTNNNSTQREQLFEENFVDFTEEIECKSNDKIDFKNNKYNLIPNMSGYKPAGKFKKDKSPEKIKETKSESVTNDVSIKIKNKKHSSDIFEGKQRISGEKDRIKTKSTNFKNYHQMFLVT